MARMRQNLEGPGFLRCQCGTRLMLVNGSGECLSCGKSAEDILRDRKRVCALDGCSQMFLPTHHGQRACCTEHSRLYELQEQRKRRRESVAKSKGNTASYYSQRAGSWTWLEHASGDERRGQKRTILTTLADKTEANDWPYPDVLAGAGPCLIDECAFL